jgi:hypothetical protein
MDLESASIRHLVDVYSCQGEIEMKRRVAVVTPAILPGGLVLFDLSDTHICIADAGIPDNKATTGQTEASNSCAFAMTMIA